MSIWDNELAGPSQFRPVQGKRAPVVLLVDDEPALRELMEITIRRHGYQVLSASSIREAQTIVVQSDTPIDVLVLDASLQGVEGPALVLSMVEQQLVKHLIYISGYEEEDCRLLVDRSQMRFIQKPFTSAVLVNAVRGAAPTGNFQ